MQLNLGNAFPAEMQQYLKQKYSKEYVYFYYVEIVFSKHYLWTYNTYNYSKPYASDLFKECYIKGYLYLNRLKSREPYNGLARKPTNWIFHNLHYSNLHVHVCFLKGAKYIHVHLYMYIIQFHWIVAQTMYSLVSWLLSLLYLSDPSGADLTVVFFFPSSSFFPL